MDPESAAVEEILEAGLYSRTRELSFLLLVVLALSSSTAIPAAKAAHLGTIRETRFAFSIAPSSVTIKVGDRATVNLTVSGLTGDLTGQVCFGEIGFPDSGFNLTFTPQCSGLDQVGARGVLVIEATPAAAPQNFTAYITAMSGNQSAQAPVTVTVVPAMAAWIPWSLVLAFFLILGIAISGRPKRLFKRHPEANRKKIE
jgi:hypothetical protein